MRNLRLPFLILIAAVAATPALAHPGHDGASLAAGLEHPLSGLDHLLAMLAVGLWASLRGGQAQWIWPASFLVSMAAGFGLGQLIPGVSVEPVILASVIVLGGLIAADARMPSVVAAALIGAFGIAHGYAHGAEAPGASLAFPLGFLLATGGLHAVGLLAGVSLRNRPTIARLLGAGAALGGIALAVVA